MDELDYNPAEDARREWHAKRLKAVQLLAAGVRPVTVAATLRMSAAAVRRWHARYRDGGLDALKVGKAKGGAKAAPNCVCETCKGAFHVRPYWIRRGYGRFCSIPCRKEAPNYGRPTRRL